MNKLQRVQIAEGVLRLPELSNCARIHARDGSTDEWQLVYSTAAFWPCTDEMQPTDGWAFLILWHISDCFHFLAPYKKNVIIRLLRSFSSVAAEYSTFGNSSCTVSHLVNMQLMLAVM